MVVPRTAHRSYAPAFSLVPLGRGLRWCLVWDRHCAVSAFSRSGIEPFRSSLRAGRGGRDDTGPSGCPALSTLPESQVNPLPIGTPARRVDARGHATERAGLTAAAKPMNGSFRLRICPRKTRVRIPKGIWPTDVFEPIRWLTRLPFEGIAMVPEAGLFSKTVDLNTNWLVPEIF